MSVLNKHIDKINLHKKEKDKELKKKIMELQNELKSKDSNYSAKYGDLGDELIIQVVLLQNELEKIN